MTRLHNLLLAAIRERISQSNRINKYRIKINDYIFKEFYFIFK
jgi:retron-type reverse transcriptase